MLATAPQLPNRIALHFAPTPNPLPAKPDAKAAAWSDAVFAAMMFYQSQLTHPDERVAERAAKAIFDLEKTRLRHGGELAGATAPLPKPEPRSSMEPLRALAPIEEPCGDDAEDAVEEDIDDAPGAFSEKERAAIEAMVRHERYAPMIEELRAKLVSQGVAEDDARTMATEAFRQHVGEAILERRGRVASRSVGGRREEHRGRMNSPRPEPANSVRELDSAQ
ncbi:MAG: hypothetical protein JNK93_20770 [Planctomycetia bacterium]|nr:hypothetical protein [Planctomycetia bacterium]